MPSHNGPIAEPGVFFGNPVGQYRAGQEAKMRVVSLTVSIISAALFTTKAAPISRSGLACVLAKSTAKT